MKKENKNSCTAGKMFAKLTIAAREARDAEKQNLYSGLGFLAQALDELHAKLDALTEGQSQIRYEVTDSVEKRLKAVGLIK